MANNKLTKDEVKHIAVLANLQLSESELTKFQEQLSETLNYIEDLNEIDTKNLEPKNSVTGLTNIESEDTPLPSLPVEEATKNAKQVQNNLFKTKAIF